MYNWFQIKYQQWNRVRLAMILHGQACRVPLVVVYHAPSMHLKFLLPPRDLQMNTILSIAYIQTRALLIRDNKYCKSASM